MANPVGRPKITPADFPEDWKERVLSEMRMGASKLEIYATVLEIDKETFARLEREDPEFSETIKKGLALAQAWWESAGRKSLRDQSFSPTLWYMNMKNRYGWRDKTETDITSKGEQLGVAVSDDQLAQLTKARAERSNT